MKYRITPRAARDLTSIGRYTYSKWGVRQRNLYLMQLCKRIEWLAENPQLGTPRNEIRPGFHSYPEGEHLIFYIVQADCIDIIGLPHRQMDISNFFQP